jgi:predicted site-specific integrase-resolvase
MARHDLKSNDIAKILGVNPATARRWIKDPGPGYIPIPSEAWATIKAAVGEA